MEHRAFEQVARRLASATGRRGAIGSALAGILAASSAGNAFASDERLKTAIEPLTSGLATIRAMAPVSYAWRDTERHGEGRDVGLIAQQVQPVLPEVVRTQDDGMYAIEYAKIVAPLISAVQELAGQVEVLRAKVDRLTPPA